MAIKRSIEIKKNGSVYNLDLTSDSREAADRVTAKWLLSIGYKPPRFFGLIKSKELSAFSKDVLRFMHEGA